MWNEKKTGTKTKRKYIRNEEITTQKKNKYTRITGLIAKPITFILRLLFIAASTFYDFNCYFHHVVFVHFSPFIHFRLFIVWISSPHSHALLFWSSHHHIFASLLCHCVVKIACHKMLFEQIKINVTCSLCDVCSTHICCGTIVHAI